MTLLEKMLDSNVEVILSYQDKLHDLKDDQEILQIELEKIASDFLDFEASLEEWYDGHSGWYNMDHDNDPEYARLLSERTKAKNVLDWACLAFGYDQGEIFRGV
ncbi:MAG: hypothetical protein NC548_22980 [Lachnospiraceae bacterium]|nr:hypothetical protein [Lachnospiraceae bacterium]